MLRIFYLCAAIAGALVPWWFFGSFFASNGPNISSFVTGLFANDAAAGFSTDVLISICVFLVWSWSDAKQHKISGWWIVLPSCLCVGLSLALPLYLYLRSATTST